MTIDVAFSCKCMGVWIRVETLARIYVIEESFQLLLFFNGSFTTNRVGIVYTISRLIGALHFTGIKFA